MKTLNVKSGKVEKWETVNLLVDNSHFPIEKVGKKFGSYGKTSYLCRVKTLVLAIRVESRERQDLIDTASEQDITDTTPFWNHPAKGGFYCSYAFLKNAKNSSCEGNKGQRNSCVFQNKFVSLQPTIMIYKRCWRHIR